MYDTSIIHTCCFQLFSAAACSLSEAAFCLGNGPQRPNSSVCAGITVGGRRSAGWRLRRNAHRLTCGQVEDVLSMTIKTGNVVPYHEPPPLHSPQNIRKKYTTVKKNTRTVFTASSLLSTFSLLLQDPQSRRCK